MACLRVDGWKGPIVIIFCTCTFVSLVLFDFSSLKSYSIHGAGSCNRVIQDKSHTVRLGCREYPRGGQSCAYSGVVCINLNRSTSFTNGAGGLTPLVYFFNDVGDSRMVSSDN